MIETSGLLLIVGAGNAGAELASAARLHGWTGRIVLLGDEPHLPYHRPPLSKAYLAGTAEADALLLRPQSAYDKAAVECMPGVRATSIDRAARRVQLHDGSHIDYEALALCTGGRARPLACAGLADGKPPSNLHTLRTRDDADALRAGLAPGRRLAIVGGGYVGLEVAASARKLGAEVTLLEALPRVLARVTGPQLSAFYETVHREAGVQIRTATRVERVECDATGDIASLVCSDGQQLAVDVVVAGIGMLPHTELAQQAGIKVDGGIVVDAFSRTSDPRIVAAGDCTVHDSALYGRRIRLESVPNALEQARAAALTLCGKPRANHSVPWFWSDQYDLKLQMVGLSQGHDAIVLRGEPASRSFIAFYLSAGRLIAADAVNRPADFMVAKKLVDQRGDVDAQALADAAVPLKSLLVAAPAPAPLAG